MNATQPLATGAPTAAELATLMTRLGRQAREAARELARVTPAQKIRALTAAAAAIRSHRDDILAANARDMEGAKARNLSGAMLDRLLLDEKRVEAMAKGIEEVAALPDPIGDIIAEWTRPNGLRIQRVRVPLGVIGIIYESRPNVTADAGALCLKSGNAVILRGGSESFHSSTAIHAALVAGLKAGGLPETAIQMVPTASRDAVGYLLGNMQEFVDVIVPRGGKNLIARVQADARVPVIGHLEGLCHVYVHKSADIGMARDVTLNAKMRRTGICGSAETLLIDRDCLATHWRPIADALAAAGCELRGDAELCRLDPRVKPATEEDWRTEYLDAILSCHVVADVDEAIRHITTYGSAHTESIIASDPQAVERFLHDLDSAIVLHNASTQFADGGEFGMGAEIGIATGRIHARGPVGATEVQFDLIVVGGGINGAGIARDAALRGISTCLLEQGDLCNSTTRWSSRLIHGGLRYLEFGELGLVHESLQERENLLRNAPHLVTPLPLLIPVYENARRGMNTVDFGLYVYDLLSIGRSVPGHRRLSKDEALAEMPGLLADGLTGAVVYYDAQVTYVERLVVENALGAAAAGARIETHTAVEKVLLERNHVTGVEVRNTVTGERSTRHAQAIINAAGPWVDRILAAAGRPLPRFMGPTRGSHIIVGSVPGLTGTACYAEARSDGRPFFIIPWNGLVLIGTTDTRTDDEPGTLRATPAEIDYLLAETHNTFPGCGLTRDDVLYAYCGARPLPRQGLRETGAITRRHQIRHHGRSARGLTSIIGGKITTYRNLAEEVLDQVAPRLRVGARSCTTDRVPLPGGEADRDEVLRELATFTAVPAGSHAHLYAVYGSRAPLVAALTRDNPELGQALGGSSGAIGAEVVFAVRGEFAVTLADVLLRRCMAGLGPDLGRDALPAALGVAAGHLGWSTDRCRAEEAAYRAEIAPLEV